jgi:hypothetical protein
MRREIQTLVCILLSGTACTSQLPEADEELLVFSSTLRYLRAHPVHGSQSQCFEERMLKRNTSKAPLLRAGDVYGYINDDFWKVMNRCSDSQGSRVASGTRYQFYQPSIGKGSATIQVDSQCGSLCGTGMIYRLRRYADRPEWYVTSSSMRWIS